MKIEIIPPKPAQNFYRIELSHAELTVLRVAFGNYTWGELVGLVMNYSGPVTGMTRERAQDVVRDAGGTSAMYNAMSDALRDGATVK